MRPVRFVALGDSLTEGVGDPVGEGRRGWAALLADGLAAEPEGAVKGAKAVEFTNLAVSGAQTRDVLERQLPAGLELRPDVVSVVVGVNDTLRCTFDIHAVAARLDTVYAAFAEQGAVLLTACLPDPGGTLGLPGALARPLARRQRAVNAVVHALSERYGAVHLHACEGAWLTDRAMWSADRLHPGERGHRQLAVRFHALLAEAGLATGRAPSPEPEFPAPTTSASLWWLATAGTGWVARRCTDLLPQLLTLAADEMRHRARGTSARLDLRASAAVSAALAALSVGERQPDAA
ncbi:SGNH/GDSL hydrolase family protein [Streptomyces sp. NPDC000618]|uniref:SGNH/GDSL hydrolase family protein n=1 Tax=Streptomyces sp. NPDC000618 TaxID=3154265 RepID=UPI00331C254A